MGFHVTQAGSTLVMQPEMRLKCGLWPELHSRLCRIILESFIFFQCFQRFCEKASHSLHEGPRPRRVSRALAGTNRDAIEGHGRRHRQEQLMQREQGEVERLASWSPSHLTSSLSLEVKCSTIDGQATEPLKIGAMS